MNDSQHNKPISTFDEICHLTIETMRRMDLEELLPLEKQAKHELEKAKLTHGCIKLVLSLKEEDRDRAIQEEADDGQQSLLDD